MSENENVSTQQRAVNFQLSTRQNLQMMAEKSTTTPNTGIEFQLPKARLLSNIYLRVHAKVKVTHATKTEIALSELAPFRLFQQLKLDLNNGFAPYTISGLGLGLMNLLDKHSDMIMSRQSPYNQCATKLKAGTAGISNDMAFTMQMPVTLNGRDPVGLLLLQSDQTIADLRVSVGSVMDMFIGEDTAGFTIELESVSVTPMLETFSIPANTAAFPDLSILKLVQDRTDSITSSGQNIVKLSTGTIYRKLILYFTDENNKPIEDSDLSGNIELVFNQADTNYSVSPEMLRAVNAIKTGSDLPKGVYIFDFSDCSYGSSRDFIDTEKLTEFWLRFNANKRGKVRVISECLSRLV